MDIIPAVCKELGTIHLLYRCKNMDGVDTACVVMMSVCAHVFVCVCVCFCLALCMQYSIAGLVHVHNAGCMYMCMYACMEGGVAV